MARSIPTFFVSLVLLAVPLSMSGCNGDSGADFYESCAARSDCISAAEDCFRVAWVEGAGTVHDNNMCSQHCAVTAECPDLGRMGAACWELDGDPIAGQRICYQRCASNLDCAVGLICADAIIGGMVVDSICLPQ